MSECDKWPEGTQPWRICMGLADMAPEKINAFRETHGYAPIENLSIPVRKPGKKVAFAEPEGPIQDSTAATRRLHHGSASLIQTTVTPTRKKGCGGCRERKALFNRMFPGSGNVVERITTATGIKRIVDLHADGQRDKQIEQYLSESEIVVKSFMRHDLLLRFVRSVRQFYPELPIRVVDDTGHSTADAEEVKSTPFVSWHDMPRDTGLPAGRNLGVRMSSAKYIILCDDDFIFEPKTDLAALLLPMSQYDLCGGLTRDKAGVPSCWCGRIQFGVDKKKKRYVSIAPISPKLIEIEGVRTYRSDLAMNFFAAKRDVLLAHPWDERYKISMEHFDSFITWKEAGVQVAFTTDCVCGHKRQDTGAYREKRHRPQNKAFLEKWEVAYRRTTGFTKFPEVDR